jgi:hypothetical protein
LVGLVSLLTTNLMWGFLVGFVLQGILWASTERRERRAQQESLACAGKVCNALRCGAPGVAIRLVPLA